MKRPLCLLGIIFLCAIPAFAQREQEIKKYEDALAVYREAGDRSGEASALTDIGRVYNRYGEREKSLEYLSQALSLHKLLGNQREEARTLSFVR